MLKFLFERKNRLRIMQVVIYHFCHIFKQKMLRAPSLKRKRVEDELVEVFRGESAMKVT
jgi:hypothetical protein